VSSRNRRTRTTEAAKLNKMVTKYYPASSRLTGLRICSIEPFIITALLCQGAPVLPIPDLESRPLGPVRPLFSQRSHRCATLVNHPLPASTYSG
jgi:hypothetical protein